MSDTPFEYRREYVQACMNLGLASPDLTRIAALAGVSSRTVSDVLRASPGKRPVANKSRARVLAVLGLSLDEGAVK